jgi:hypothetical protein
MDLIGVGGGQVGEGIEVAMEGIDLLLDGGEVNRNGDVDVGHLGSDSADGLMMMWWLWLEKEGARVWMDGWTRRLERIKQERMDRVRIKWVLIT